MMAITSCKLEAMQLVGALARPAGHLVAPLAAHLTGILSERNLPERVDPQWLALAYASYESFQLVCRQRKDSRRQGQHL